MALRPKPDEIDQAEERKRKEKEEYELRIKKGLFLQDAQTAGFSPLQALFLWDKFAPKEHYHPYDAEVTY